MSDELYMKKALSLAAKGRGRTSPNPMVGAVLVKNGSVIASDYHRKAGTPHAEALVLSKAGKAARGAALYVSLEPCCHTEKKTPPCTKAILESGVKKVVVAMIDPNPKVSGKGLNLLREAGIEVVSGIMESEAMKLNEAFVKYITKKIPFVILKAAQSLDGKIATASGESKWITGEKARAHVHRLRNELDAVLVGSGTVKKDDPSLDCRLKGGRDPYRIIVDSSLSIPLNAKVLKHNDGKTIIATSLSFRRGGFETRPYKKELIPYEKKIASLKALGVKVLPVKQNNGRVDLKSLMKELGKLEITSLMIEGGSTLNASALSSGIVDKVMFFIAPKIIGGETSIGSVGGEAPELLKNAFNLRDLEIKKIGMDILVEGYLR